MLTISDKRGKVGPEPPKLGLHNLGTFKSFNLYFHLTNQYISFPHRSTSVAAPALTLDSGG